ncbi:CynX/NimT family MFS transporter [Novosphingobium sp. FKTRR1]|uniref:MFS transporter n=1 Tax=Novosphingobium sp. FKTRR1 TaxID=2879118 RepID=UPI001CF02646|nr:MFS transporter [Novosphingobium sp. FKTRR1]
MSAPLPAGRARMMLLRGFLCQNVAIGCAFGSFGVALIPLQEKFGVGRGLASLGIALAVMMMGLAAPLAAPLINRIGLRAMMVGGIVMSAAGYVLLALASNIGMVLFAYAVPIGLGLVGFGPLPSTVLAGNWFRSNPGPAAGLVNMPVLMVLVPLVTLPLIREGGLSGLYLALAALHVALLPFAFGIVDAPEDEVAGTAAIRSVPGHHNDNGTGLGTGGAVSATTMLGQPLFWGIVLGSGILHAVGIIASSHLVAFGIERGIAAGQASLLAAVMGGASVVGAFGSGLLCARLGGGRALALIAAGTATGWMALFLTQSLWPMALGSLVIGAGGAAVFPAISVLAGERFGARSLTRALGLFGLATLPMNFGLPPLAGVLRDMVGSYDPVVLVIVAACIGVAALYFAISRVPVRLAPTLA